MLDTKLTQLRKLILIVVCAHGRPRGNKEMGHSSWWYSGEIDLGFSAALRTAATVISDDPIFGLYAYGGELTRHGASIEVIPRDGLRDRFYVVRGNTRFQMRLSFRIENRSKDQQETTLTLKGLPPGSYRVFVGWEAMSK